MKKLPVQKGTYDLNNDPDMKEKLEHYNSKTYDVLSPSTHARLSPSSAKRWMTCPGSVKLIESLNLPYQTSKYAAEGTVAHSIGDQCLSKNLEPKSFLGKTMEADGFKFKVNREMIEAVEVYVDYIYDLITQAEMSADTLVEKQIEVRCSLKSLGVEGMDGGTSDAVLICREHSFIEVIDYKHGQGVAVDVDDNPQLMSYGLGALIKVCKETKTKPNDWEIWMTIVQPRAHHPDGVIRTCKIKGRELNHWGNNILVPAAKATHEDGADLVPSDDGCRFCSAAGNCPSLYQKTQEIAIADFKEDKFPVPATMTAEQKIIVMDHAKMISSFIIAVENQVKLEVDSGSKEYEGSYKLVRKTTHRKFTDDALDPDFGELLDHLTHDQIFVSKPKPMGEIERILKKEHGKDIAKEIMDEITIKPEGELVIAPLSDKRKAAQPSIISDFDGLES